MISFCWGNTMDTLKKVEKMDIIPLYPALNLILKGHTNFFEKKTGRN